MPLSDPVFVCVGGDGSFCNLLWNELENREFCFCWDTKVKIIFHLNVMAIVYSFFFLIWKVMIFFVL